MATPLETGFVQLEARGKDKVKRDLSEVNQAFRRSADAAGSAVSAMKSLLGGVAVGAAVKQFISLVESQELAERKLTAVLKASGNTVGMAAGDIMAYASALQQSTRFGDEATITAAAFLATLDKLSGSTFKDALRISQDLATVLGTDLEAAARMVGKALQSPSEGLTALRRVGVRFTASQEEQLAAMVASGREAEAQQMILAELEKRFGGAAEAAGTTLVGELERLKNAFGDLIQAIGMGNDGPLKGLVARYREIAQSMEEIIRLRRETAHGGESGTPEQQRERMEQMVAQGDVEGLQGMRARLLSAAHEYNQSWAVQLGIASPSNIAKFEAEMRQNIAQAARNRAAGATRTDPAAEANRDRARRQAEEAAARAREQDEASGRRQIDQEIELAKLRGDNIAAVQLENEKMHEAWYANIKKAGDLSKAEYEKEAAHIEAIKAARLEAAQQREAEEQRRIRLAGMEARQQREREQAQADADAALAQLEKELGARGRRMGLTALEQAIQQAALGPSLDIQLARDRLEELKRANRQLENIDKNIKDVDRFGAGAVA